MSKYLGSFQNLIAKIEMIKIITLEESPEALLGVV